MLLQIRKSLLVFLSVALLLLTSCASAPPSRYQAVQQESSQKGATAVVRQSQSGGSFNRFFPPEQDGYKRIYTQEKKGFAEAKLIKGGKDLAVLAISDTLNTPTAKVKFANSTEKIAGYPAVQQGATATALLVGDRFQVKVLSRDSSFTSADRASWLERFKLNELAKLVKS
jgi:hypothetical protein